MFVWSGGWIVRFVGSASTIEQMGQVSPLGHVKDRQEAVGLSRVPQSVGSRVLPKAAEMSLSMRRLDETAERAGGWLARHSTIH